MIRNGVRAHFDNVELSDGLVTSYFDKLIQVPITVPHLGIAEIKVYMVLLFWNLKLEEKMWKKAYLKRRRMNWKIVISGMDHKYYERDKIAQGF